MSEYHFSSAKLCYVTEVTRILAEIIIQACYQLFKSIPSMHTFNSIQKMTKKILLVCMNSLRFIDKPMPRIVIGSWLDLRCAGQKPSLLLLLS